MNTNCPHLNNNNITYSVNNRPIYKDQCVRCFDDQVI